MGILRVSGLALGLVAAFSSVAQGDVVPVIIHLNPSHRMALAPDFEGLSYESSILLPGNNGLRYFRAGNGALIRMYRTLGIKSLRIGANAVDDPRIPIPGRAEVDDLFGFARAAGVKVIYSFRLKHGNVAESAKLAQYIFSHDSDCLDCFCIGNEPNLYLAKYSDYASLWKPYCDAISQACPGVKFCGPAAASAENWAVNFARQFGPTGKIAFVAQHEYPFGGGNVVKDAEAARERMLTVAGYEPTYAAFAPAVEQAGLPYRMEETNNFFNGGARDVSDTYAAALWGLDYDYWWAAHGSQGVNFHTGDQVGAEGTYKVCNYTAILSAPDGYAAHPLAYGLLLFHLGACGPLIEAQASFPQGETVNLRTYATTSAGGATYVTLINREKSGRPSARATFSGRGGPLKVDKMIYLRASSDDIATKTGLSVGGVGIQDDGSWAGSWTTVAPGDEDAIAVPTATAVVVKLTPVGR